MKVSVFSRIRTVRPVLAFLLCLSCGGLRAATATAWKSAADGSWTVGANWTNGVPTASSYNRIDLSAADYTVKVDGAELIAAGVGTAGKISVTNLVVRNESGAATLLVTNGAEVTFLARMPDDAAAPLHLEKGSRLKIVDSSVCFRDHGNLTGAQSNISPIHNEGGEIEVCGTGRFVNVGREWQGDKYPNNQNGQFTLGSGSLVFRDNSEYVTCYSETHTNKCGWNSVFYTNFRPFSSGDLKVEFLDNSHFSLGVWELHFGGNGRHVEFIADTSYAKTQSFGTNVNIGDANGLTEVRLKRGTYYLGSYYCSIATPGGDDGQYATALFVTSRVEIASGAAATSGYTYLRSMNIGQGLSLSKSRGGAFVRGELEVSGSYSQAEGSFYVGSGPCAEGLVHQTGGSVQPVTSSTPKMVGEVAIGLFGGKGLYRLEDGIFETRRNVYVGGATTNDLHWASHKNAALLQTYHDAQGEVRVSGGSFTILDDRELVLGSDGTGVLALSSTGTVTATTVIVSNTSNQEPSALKFTSDEEGRFGTLNVQSLQFCKGSKLIVDATLFPKDCKPRVLLSLPNPVDGLDYIRRNVEIVNCPEGGAVKWSADGRQLRFGILRSLAIFAQ